MAQRSYCLMLLALIAAAGPVNAAWKTEPYVRLEQEYDDNVRLVATDEESAAVTTLTGATEFSRITEISTVATLLRVDGVRYEDQEFDDELNYQGRYDGSFNTSPLNRWGIRAAYEKDTLLRTVAELVVPDTVAVTPDDDVDAALVTQNVDRHQVQFRPWWSRDLTQRARTDAAYSLRAVKYDDETDQLSDYIEHTLSAGWAYKTSEISELTAALVASHYRADEFDREYEDYQARIGFTHEFSEISDGGIEVGYRETQWDTDGESSDDNGYVVNLFASRRSALTRYSGRLGRSVYPSGAGDLIVSDELALKVVRDLSPRLRFWTRLRAFQNESIRDDTLSANRRYLSIRPVISWNITRWWSVEGSYRYRRQKRDTDDSSAESNAVFIALRYAFPVIGEEEAQP